MSGWFELFPQFPINQIWIDQKKTQKTDGTCLSDLET